jgi:hypothetical protein
MRRAVPAARALLPGRGPARRGRRRRVSSARVRRWAPVPRREAG